jgi:D-proline reductase (dithiol) PrdB
MSDVAALEGWQEKYESWRESALPRMAKGEAKQAFASYPWFSAPGDPFTRLAKPASESRFALITTGGYSIEGEQEPMQPIPNLGGATPQVREIPLDVDPAKLVIHHPGYDHRFAKEDHNVNLPLDRLRELAGAGEIGSIAPMTQVLMGLVVDVAPLLRETIPQLVDTFRKDEVDAVLLVPS